ncbi:hypothetical protein HO173_009155 [Letharia columbiana]|uniref:Poly A polymerase head domain-containing protein n=1 Tax=Letharia columbiana TaxID=112416 RepID=A0A8H6L236_9LECA|nr:uncharacterized protein HO173_009155 [Letharia columbiana]KAF6232716.1 hypothetical protein HO173_009155 [Letharia columbiana]
MKKSIKLTPEEATLRQLFLDISSYLVTLGDYRKKPELRFAGGWVRDKLLNLPSKDIDVAISNMTGSEFGSLMKQYVELPEARHKYGNNILGRLAKIEANPEKSKHLETATMKVLGFDIDLVNLRKETYTNDSRNPTVEFGTPKEDALRRDSTINALFYNLETSKVEDFTGRGFQDMKRKVIKTPLAPLQTFKDDPLRVLRSIRFASRLMYEIDPEDEMAMRDRAIKAALRLKITRDRVRVEILKMLGWPEPHQSLCFLEGPSPHRALSLIDRLGLYNEVFTDPTIADCKLVDTANWCQTYNQLRDIIMTGSEGSTSPESFKTIRPILLQNPEDFYHAWILTCFVPWAREPPRSPQKSSKRPISAAGLAAREGIKAENKIYKLVDDAVTHLQDIVEKKNAVSHEDQTTTLPLKRKQGACAESQRELQGMAIRKWGPNWRSSAMYALLAEVAEAKTVTDSRAVLDGYSSWLLQLQSLNLLKAYETPLLVKGDGLMEAFNCKGGNWLPAALDCVMKWQLRNPDRKDAAGAIAEVLERKEELNIPP